MSGDTTTPVVPLKRLLGSIDSGVSVNAVDIPAEVGQLGVMKTSCVYSGRFESSENKAVVPEDYGRVNCPVRAGSLVVSRMNTPDLVGAAGFVTKDEPNLFLPDRLWQVTFDESKVQPRFMYWWTQSAMYRDQVRVACAGTSSSMQNLDQESFRSFAVPRISRSLQACIANFLDDKTARIDALIAEKERLVDRLTKMKRDAIDAAVLGAGASCSGQPLKGLEVLGSIPAAWAASRMKFELEYVTSGSRGWAEHYANDGALFVRIGNLTRDSIELDLSDVQRVALPDAAEGVRARVQQGDLLISITAYLGSVAVAPVDIEEAYVSQHVSLARPNGLRALPKWLGYVVLSSIGRTFFDLQAYGGTKVQLSLDDIRELPVPLPSTEVQRERIYLLEARLLHLSELASHAQAHIARLREYRSSLISAAVTGQLTL